MQQFTATGTYSDNSTQNLTSQVTWASATHSTATITAGGLATGVGAGTSSISATLGLVVGSTVLTVSAPPTVVSFSVLFGSQSYNLIGTNRTRLPWQITGIQVVFSEPIASGNLSSLGGVTATNLTGLGSNTLTWSINSIALGSFSTTLAGAGPNALKDGSGIPLAGGAGYGQTLNILWGDINDDGDVNASDVVLANNATSEPYNIFADMNGDGVVDINDVQIVRSQVGNTLPVSMAAGLRHAASPTFQPIDGRLGKPIGVPKPLPK